MFCQILLFQLALLNFSKWFEKVILIRKLPIQYDSEILCIRSVQTFVKQFTNPEEHLQVKQAAILLKYSRFILRHAIYALYKIFYSSNRRRRTPRAFPPCSIYILYLKKNFIFTSQAKHQLNQCQIL